MKKMNDYNKEYEINSLFDVTPFGKFKGEILTDILDEKTWYVKWMLENCKNINFSDSVLSGIERELGME